MVWTCDEDWVKKCMEYRVEGRRPVGRPRKTWLESVEADMAELEIDKEYVHDRRKWRRNVVKRKLIQPYQKTDYKPIIYNELIHGLIENMFSDVVFIMTGK